MVKFTVAIDPIQSKLSFATIDKQHRLLLKRKPNHVVPENPDKSHEAVDVKPECTK